MGAFERFTGIRKERDKEGASEYHGFNFVREGWRETLNSSKDVFDWLREFVGKIGGREKQQPIKRTISCLFWIWRKRPATSCYRLTFLMNLEGCLRTRNRAPAHGSCLWMLRQVRTALVKSERILMAFLRDVGATRGKDSGAHGMISPLFQTLLATLSKIRGFFFWAA